MAILLHCIVESNNIQVPDDDATVTIVEDCPVQSPSSSLSNDLSVEEETLI